MLRVLSTARRLGACQGPARQAYRALARTSVDVSICRPATALWASRLQYSTAKTPAERPDKEKMSAALRQALTQEIFHEQENPPEPDDWAKYFNATKWTITDKPGLRDLTLVKMDGKDRVTVNLALADLDFDDSIDEENPTQDISFTVSVSKKRGTTDHGTLTFEAMAKDGNIAIVAVYLCPDTAAALDFGPATDQQRVTVYPGPLMDELDEELIGKFTKYLASLGVDREFAIMMEHMYYDKDQREYEHWLKSIAQFLEI